MIFVQTEKVHFKKIIVFGCGAFIVPRCSALYFICWLATAKLAMQIKHVSKKVFDFSSQTAFSLFLLSKS